uniref:FGFR1 oncogene partner 2 homolog n=1 Tax=Pristionchus pacificus TaxID=54126 RepID=A0A8R1U6Y1_PRIPA
MARELEDLVVDARLLALTAKESESKLDAMLRRANTISGRLNMTREYQRDVEKMLVATGKLDRRKGLLEDLQRENRMINSYKEENSMLRDQLEKSYATADEIVARHRAIMQRVQSEQAMCHLSPAILQKICDSEFRCDVTARNEQIEAAHRMMDVMRYCEVLAQRDTERFARVVKENRNLRELLNYAAISDPAIIAHFRRSMEEYDRDQKARVLSRKRACCGEEGGEASGDEEEDEETSVLFNRTNLSQSTEGNATMRLATTPSSGGAASKRLANGVNGTGVILKLKAPGAANDGWNGFGGGSSSSNGGGFGSREELAESVEDVLAGIDELSEEDGGCSDAETVLDRDDRTECEEGLREQEQDEVAAPDALVSLSPPAKKKELDADSGTASSLSSSPASSSSSEGDLP